MYFAAQNLKPDYRPAKNDWLGEIC